MVGLQPSSASLQQYQHDGVDLRPEIWVSSSTVGWRWRGTSTTFRVSAFSTSDNCESSVDPSLRTLLMLWYALLYICVSTTVTGFSFPVRVTWLTNYRQFSARPLGWYCSCRTDHLWQKLCIGSCTGWMWKTGWTTRLASSSSNVSTVWLPVTYPNSAFRLQLSPVAPTCAHPWGWTDNCTSHEQKQRHWVHEGSTMPRLLCRTRSRQTCMIPDFRSTPSWQVGDWNIT